MINLGIINPLLLDQHLIISISKDWVNHFSKIPTFVVSIDKNKKLSIVSVEEINNGS